MIPPRRLSGCVLFAVLLLSRAPAAAQERSFATGNLAFRFTLGTLCGLRPITDKKELLREAQHSVLVVTGDTSELETGDLWLNTYLTRGGSLLLATDRETTPRVLNRIVGVGIAGGQVKALDAAAQYKGNEDCPIVVGRRHPIFDELSHPLATNRPSYAVWEQLPRESPARRFHFEAIASFPDGCRRADEVPGSLLPFAMAGTYQDNAAGWNQRLLVLADHSVFINCMMFQDDNGNMQFAYRCLSWLSEDGRRSRVMYVDEGKVVTDLKVGLDEILLTLPPTALNLPAPAAQVINNVVAAWQDDNIHNRLLLERFSLGEILRVAAIAITSLLIGYGAMRLWSARHSTEPGR